MNNKLLITLIPVALTLLWVLAAGPALFAFICIQFDIQFFYKPAVACSLIVFGVSCATYLGYLYIRGELKI